MFSKVSQTNDLTPAVLLWSQDRDMCDVVIIYGQCADAFLMAAILLYTCQGFINWYNHQHYSC